MLLCSFLLASVGWAMAEEDNTGNTIYVDASSGSDESNDGTTSDKAVKTLAKALEKATAGGETIQLAAGQYTLSKALKLTDKSLSIVGSDKSSTTVKGNIELEASSTDISLAMKNLTWIGTNNTSTHGIIGLIGSGTGKNRLTLTNCAVKAEETVTNQKASVGVRMESKGAELTMTDTDIDVHYYGIGIRNVSQSVTISGGTITGWAAIMTSAGDITSTDNSGTFINVSNAKLVGRAILNGYDQDYGTVVLQENYHGVHATIKNCNISTSAIENINANQMSALDIRSFGNVINVTGGTLAAETAVNTIKQADSQYSHAAIISLGYSDNQICGLTDKKNQISISNATLTISAKQMQVFSYRSGEDKKLDELVINESSYTYTAGNILYGSATADCSPQSRINYAIDGEKIVLPAGEYELSSQLTINKAITLEGAINNDGAPTTTLKRTEAWSGTNNSSKHMVDITASNVTLKNLVIDGNNLTSGVTGSTPEGSGINVYKASNVTLENVISKNNKGGGLIVNVSNVTAKNFHTEGNGYGINLDKGENVTGTPTLSIDDKCSVAETTKIYGPTSLLTENSVKVPDGWITTKVTFEGTEYRVWTDKVITTNDNTVFANGYPVTITASENSNKVKIFRTAYPADFVEVASASAVVYGGSLNASVDSTSITMTGGKLTGSICNRNCIYYYDRRLCTICLWWWLWKNSHKLCRRKR